MSNNMPHRFPVAIKGVCIQDGRVLLLYNERDEWELPGGKLELGEDPAHCVTREIQEESGWATTAETILDSWQYHIHDGIDVLVVTYGCTVHTTTAPHVSHEHKKVGLFTRADLDNLAMPQGYKASINTWYQRLPEKRA